MYEPGWRQDPQGKTRWSENGRWGDQVRDSSGGVYRDHHIPSTPPQMSAPRLPNAASPPGGGSSVIDELAERNRQVWSDKGAGAVQQALGGMGTGGFVAILAGLAAMVFLFTIGSFVGAVALPIVAFVLYRKGTLRGVKPAVLGSVWFLCLATALTTVDQFSGSGLPKEVEQAQAFLGLMGSDSVSMICDEPYMTEQAKSAMAAKERASDCAEAVGKIKQRLDESDFEDLSHLNMTKTDRGTYLLDDNPLGWREITISTQETYGILFHAIS
ncbi:hypothetical protein AB0B45_31335 [Nonomuraea sp. NPDC049152]|uniref:hypothetical protein n=1 Tax=Nonomuraea sp. NPDC049152 TaxID=3154350 RepID=UPI0033CB27A3